MEMANSSNPQTPRIIVSLATYNERENISQLISSIHEVAPQLDILVVDDNSPDGTGQVVDQLATSDPRIHVLHRPGKMGLGTALIAAMRYAIDQKYDMLLNMDADFSHPPRYIPNMLAGMEKNDVMIGSRYVQGGGYVNWPLSRIVISRSVNMLVRILLRMPVRDASGGYRCYRLSRVKLVDFSQVRSVGYSFQQEMLFRCFQVGCKLGETPIIFENRRLGASKVTRWESIRSLYALISLGIRNMLGLERKRSTKSDEN